MAVGFGNGGRLLWLGEIQRTRGTTRVASERIDGKKVSSGDGQRSYRTLGWQKGKEIIADSLESCSVTLGKKGKTPTRGTHMAVTQRRGTNWSVKEGGGAHVCGLSGLVTGPRVGERGKG